MASNKLAPLDYDVEIPRLIPLILEDSHLHWAPRYLGRFDRVPLFGEYAPTQEEGGEDNDEIDYDDFTKDSYTPRELVSYFEKFVTLVAKVTKSLREPDLQDWERKELLDMFYGDEWADWGNYLSPRDNYYYAQSVPELRAVEVALFFLSSPDYPWQMNVSEVRQHIDALKLQLWQCLPDFYAAHDHPMPRPLSYQQDKPYPLFHTADDFISGLRPAIPEWIDSDFKEEGKKYLPDVSEAPVIDRLSFEVDKHEDIIVKSTSGQSFWIDTNTAVADPHELIAMIQDMIMLKDPAYYGHDPEGDVYHFTTMAADDPSRVRLAIYFMPYSAKEYNYNHVSGTFDRRQLANDLIRLCELMGERVELGVDERWLERLKSIM